MYVNKLNNTNKITSKGTDSNGYGGASGGGSINIFYNELINRGSIEATGGNGVNGGNGGDGCRTLQDINMKLPNIKMEEVTETSFKVSIEEPNQKLEGVTYDYFINDKIYIKNTTSLQEIIKNLNNYNVNYKIQVGVNFNDGVVYGYSNIINITLVGLEGKIYVYDENGDSIEENPFNSLSSAIDASNDGYSIHIREGIYNLENMEATSGFSDNGIYDQNKRIEIYGENDETILVYDGAISTKRDAHAIQLLNKDTVVRNLTYIFKPKLSTNYSKAIFGWCNGNVENVFFRISGNKKASYLYYNTQLTPNNIVNCTFFHDLKSVDEDYSGKANFKNIATNVLMTSIKDNVIHKDFGTIEDDIFQLINASKEDADFNENKVGVYYGDNAWK